MSTIGGPGGVGGPKGPSGPDRPEDVGDVGEATATAAAEPARATTGAGDLDAIASELAAGRLTPHEAVERLVDQIAGSHQLGAADRTELRELLAELVANDPHLAALVGRI